MQDQKCIVFMTRKRHWTSDRDLRTPFKSNAKKGGGTVMLLMPITLDSCRWLVTSLYTCLPIDYLISYIHTCIALQTSAGLDAILGFGLSILINAASFPSLICAPTTSNICETQLFQPVTENTPLTAKVWALWPAYILKWFVSRRNNQSVLLSSVYDYIHSTENSLR